MPPASDKARGDPFPPGLLAPEALPDPVGDPLRQQPELEQRLIVLPGADLHEDRDEEREAQQHRQCHRPGALAPDVARLAREHHHQGKHHENAERVADPPGEPARAEIGGVDRPQQPHRRERKAGGRPADHGRQQEEAREVARIVQRRGIADEATQCPPAERPLERGGRRDGDCDRRGDRRQLVDAGGTDVKVEQERAEEDPRQRAGAADERRGDGQPRRREDRGRIARRHRQKQADSAADDVSEGKGEKSGKTPHWIRTHALPAAAPTRPAAVLRTPLSRCQENGKCNLRESPALSQSEILGL
jgi:hypothetical protein